MKRFAIAVLLTASLVPAMAEAQGAKLSSQIELARMADMLKPGEWIWAPQIAPAGPVMVYVDLDRQLATIYRNGVRIAVSTVSSGKPGHETPTGVFTILQKDAKHRSSTYNNAPMPFQQRLTWDGVALHAGGLPGYPESHGCVHLPYDFSRELFQITEMGGTVVIAGRHGAPMRTRAAGVLAPLADGGLVVPHIPLAANEPWRWTPESAPEGPLTVVVSQSDQRVIVLRNGIEIGRSRATVEGDPFATHVMTLTRGADGKLHWLFVGVPGHAGEAGHAVDATVLERLRLPKRFLANLRSALVPGTTVLVTQAPVGATTTGQSLTLLSGVDGPLPIDAP
jgi:hypothetical protein